MNQFKIKHNEKYINFSEDLKKREKSILAFYNSPIYKKMINDVKRKNHPLASYEWKLFPEKIRDLFNWGDDIYDNHINTFIHSMAYDGLPKENEIAINDVSLSFQRDQIKVKIVIEDSVHVIINDEK